MKKTIFLMLSFLAVISAQAQTIRLGQKFWDGESLYTVKEIRMGKYVYMTTSQDNELTLEKVKEGEYKIIPSRQADDCPFGAEFGWKVQHIRQEGENFLYFAQSCLPAESCRYQERAATAAQQDSRLSWIPFPIERLAGLLRQGQLVQAWQRQQCHQAEHHRKDQPSTHKERGSCKT